MHKQIIILVLLIISSVGQAYGRVSSISDDLILKGLAAPSDWNQLALINDFSENLQSVCKRERLPSCAFPQLFKIYKQDLAAVINSEFSGLQIASIPGFEESFSPQSLQSGAWISVPFSFADGTETVTRMIVTKIALEKALLVHKNYLNKINSQPLNDFATFAMPQMIASLSGYSTSLKALKYAENFSCRTSESFRESTFCDEKKNLIASLQAEINNSLDEDTIIRLSQLDTSNSIDKVLKTKMVVEATKAIQSIRIELGPDQILAAIQGKDSFIQIQNLENTLTEMSLSPVAIDEIEYHRMLVAVAILSEIQSIKESSWSVNSKFQYSETPLKKKIMNEMNLLKNWIAMYLTQQEEIPQ